MKIKIPEIANLTLNILQTSPEEKYSVKRLHDTFREKYPNHNVSYPLFVRAVDMLIIKKQVKSEDFGFVRFVWL